MQYDVFYLCFFAWGVLFLCFTWLFCYTLMLIECYLLLGPYYSRIKLLMVVLPHSHLL